MNSASKKRDAKAIFSAAVEDHPPEEWEDYVASVCGEDEALRERVGQLLDAHRQHDSFIDANAEMTTDFGTTQRPGTQIGPYKLLQRIGEGGFGAVYMAEQIRPVQRKVALKIIKPGMDSRDVIARFEAERQALALMDHPNIAKVLDAGTTDSGRPYFVMELVKGVPVTEYCDRNRLTTRERLELFVTLCRAVQHAHQKGVIHRDIKPSNVMVTLHDGKPVPKVIDFGVSKALNQQLTEKTLFTRYGQMIGTPQYMSPEQAEMSGLDVDTRSDVYSLGVVLYELLTGQTPLQPERLKEAGFMEMQRIIIDDEPPRPSVRLSTLGEQLTVVAKDRNIDPARLRQTIAGELDWIVMKALEKDRARRYETASGFADDVVRYLADEPIEACPPSTTYRLRKFVRRNKGPVAAVVAVSIALVFGILGTSAMYFRAEKNRQQAERNGQRAVQLAATADHNAKEARRLAKDEQAARQEATNRANELDETLYLHRIKLAHENILANKPVDARQLLRECPERLRDWEWHYLMRRCYSEPIAPIGFPGRVFCIEFGPTSDELLAGLHDGSAVRLNLSNGETTEFPGSHEVPEWITKSTALSPDGKLVAKVDVQNTVTLWNADSGEKLQTFRGHTAPAYCVAFSPQGDRVVSAGEDSTARVWNVKTGEEMNVFTSLSPPWAVVFGPQGRRLACGGIDGNLELWDTDTEEQIFANSEHFAPINTVAFSPDGTRLASGGSDYVIKIWDTTSGEKALPDLTGHKADVNCVAFNRTGSRIASAGYDGSVRIWDAKTGREMLVFGETLEIVYGVSFSHDGHKLASGSGDNDARIYDATPWDERLQAKPELFGGFQTRVTLAIDPTGKRMAAGGEDGTIRVWNLSNGAEVGNFEKHGDVVFDITFGPQGKNIFSSGGAIGPRDPQFNSAVVCWNPISPTEAERYAIPSHREVYAVAVTPDGRLLAMGGISKSLRLFDAETGRPIREVDGAHERLVTGLSFSPHGKYLASVEEGRGVTIWKTDELNNLDTQPVGRRLFSGRGGWSLLPSFSPDEKQVAIVDGNDAVIVDVETEKTLLRIPAHGDWANCAVFSPDGKVLATGGADGTVRLWHATTGGNADQRPIKTFLSEGTVYRVAFTPDGRRLAAASEDGFVRLWDVSFLQSSAIETLQSE